MRYQKILCLILFCSPLVLSAQEIKIIDKPIIYDSTRIQLTLQYLKDRHGINQKTVEIEPKIIVLHWTASKTMLSAFNTFNKPTLDGGRKAIAGASNLNVSSQFLIDRDGSIYRLMPENVFARHVIGLNYCAIGVENVGSNDFPLTKEQLIANEQLVRYLSKKYEITHLIGHYEYNQFKGTKLWKETDPNYQTGKTDPGVAFMEKIRINLKDLKLKGASD
ncbi:N-acetylmuramoyl-L-alanine amidase [Pedobacter insulae]|uniref:N-acetylmuramoyl-L-alanine amidase n=1 Tax=Pedobacter insulae TaxID=414048 RepID=A0A1I2XWF5_9SPHI|nr:peptidoglycan recognition family protein [Pedobacter insulae]SFH17820.1 N-acetylmuramoyl-L-alanine amidase [Pedobacter insulae]